MRATLTAVAAVLLPLTACGAGQPEPAAGIQRLRVEVLAELPHDRAAFTQGLEFAGDQLYESTGRVGASTVRRGAPGAPPARVGELPPPLFGEGITVVGGTLWQLTWRDGVAVRRDPASLAELGRVPYEGEGWGLCHRPDGTLVMSDGSDRLTFRDPSTFQPKGAVTVREAGTARRGLNELECVGGDVYANVWQTDTIMRIDAASGAVTGRIEASGLLKGTDRDGADVLNGIAAVPGTDQFLITGKLWPKMFRVRFTAAP